MLSKFKGLPEPKFYVFPFSEKVEVILQKTLYEAREKKGFTVLEETVSKTMEQVMEIRESLLKRIKDLRKEEIKTDPEQNIKQEEMLSEFRMKIMTILLKLVDKDAASIDKLNPISHFFCYWVGNRPPLYFCDKMHTTIH